MTVDTHDHRTIASCACVHRRLVIALGMLDEAKENAKEAAAVLDRGGLETPETRDEACRAVELLHRAGQLRSKATDEIREAVRAIEDPPPHAVALRQVSPGSAGSLVSPTTPAA